ncbi:hypothetical protein BH23BAC1_BH23BAC1_18540 [soil metagenome]
MKKNKLIVDYGYDFELLGIISPVKDYKIAWAINNTLNFKFKKNNDLKIEFINDKQLIISNYTFETENSLLRLLKNKSQSVSDLTFSYLIPELKNFDYFIKIEDEADTFNQALLIKKIKTIPLIQYITTIDAGKLRSKENLLF